MEKDQKEDPQTGPLEKIMALSGAVVGCTPFYRASDEELSQIYLFA